MFNVVLVYERLGFFEGEILIVYVVIYFVVVFKLNVVYVVWNKVKVFVKNSGFLFVFFYFCNVLMKLM